MEPVESSPTRGDGLSSVAPHREMGTGGRLPPSTCGSGVGTKHSTFSLEEVSNAEQSRRHPATAFAILQAALVWRHEVGKLLDQMDDEGIDLMSSCTDSTFWLQRYERRQSKS